MVLVFCVVSQLFLHFTSESFDPHRTSPLANHPNYHPSPMRLRGNEPPSLLLNGQEAPRLGERERAIAIPLHSEEM